jgi:hypothetical protein
LRAVGASQIAFVGHVKRDGVRGYDLGAQNMPPPRVAKIELKIFGYERGVPYQAAHQFAP